MDEQCEKKNMNPLRKFETIGQTAFGNEPVRRLVLLLLLLLCIGITYYCHFVKRIDVVFSHLFYVPIIVAGFWWCKRAIWVALFLAAWLVCSRILSGLHVPAVACLLRAGMFVMVGAVAGYLRNRCQKAEERQLRETRDFLENLLNYSNAPIIVWEPSFKIMRFNRAFERLTGIDASSAIGQPLDILFPDDSREQAMAHIRRTAEGQRWEVVEIAIRRTDGTQRIVLWNSANIYADDGRTLIATIAQGTDITERKYAEDSIKASLREKEVLLKEIHHRVKNNLQVVSSLLNLQLKRIEDKEAVEMLREGRDRIRAMALIHEALYGSENLSGVDFTGYVRTLAERLFRSYGISSDTVALEIAASEAVLGIDTAIPCGLIINELVSNSLKHAFPNGRKGKIRINLHSEGNNRFLLTVSDNGIGFPADVDFRSTESLGLQLVCTLIDQLEGTIELHREQGTEFRIAFSETTQRNHMREQPAA